MNEYWNGVRNVEMKTILKFDAVTLIGGKKQNIQL